MDEFADLAEFPFFALETDGLPFPQLIEQIGRLRSLKVTERYAGGLVKLITATSVTGATSTLTPRTSEGWRIALGLPGAWVSGITGR